MKPRIIICGLGRTGHRILNLLRHQGAAVVGISNRPQSTNDPDIIVGNLQEASTLLAAGIQEAQTLIVADSDDASNLAVLMKARSLNPNIRIINRIYNSNLGDRLDCTLPNHFSMSVSSLSAPVFTFAALGSQSIGQLQLFQQTWPIYEEVITTDHPWRGRRLSEIWDNRARMLIYYLPANGHMDLVTAVVRRQRLLVGDRLIIGTQPVVRNNQLSLRERLTQIPASLQQFQQHARSMLVVTLALAATIFLATTIYLFTNFQTPVVDALYFSVGMITGAGGHEEVVEAAPASVKVFTALMMLVGAGVIGVCYALLNDFVLGTRFRKVWEAVRIPHRDHYIVCGLGGLGMQIVQHLHANGHEVVAVERDANNRFLSTARALKVPVIQGDANLPATLQAANLKHAEALLPVTSNDIANLEITLNAKGIAPKVPAIVRYDDPEYAKIAQEVFGFEAVLSPTELAAPAFAAAAIGGRILGSGMTGDSLWVALATAIAPNHPFCGRPIQDVAMASDFVPLYLETEKRTVHGWHLLQTVLKEGDVLYLTIPATRLEQLWRVSPPQPDINPIAQPSQVS